MNSGPASRTRSSVKRRRCSAKTRRPNKSKLHSFNRLPDEVLQIVLEYTSFDGIGLRLVCRRFDAIISSFLLSSVSAFASTLPFFDYHKIKFQMNGSMKSAGSSRMNEPLCPIDSHIRHVTVKLSHDESDGNYDQPANMKAYKSLLARIVKRMPKLKSVKLLHNLDEIEVRYSEFPPIRLEESQTGMDKLITSTLNRIPANIHVEVELAVRSHGLDGQSVSLRPADWTVWQHNNQFYHFLTRRELEQWPNSIEEVWRMVDSLNISASITFDGGHPYTSPPGLGEIPEECISNPHIFSLYDRMVPGAFLTLQFPNGFPPHLKKLHLRDPLIVNTTRVLKYLRDCQHLKDLSLFVVFNLESVHEEHGLPPGLETLELFESGGTILPTSYDGLRQFRYTFIGEPSDGHINRVRHFIEHTHIPQLELNIVSTSDLIDASDPFLGLGILSAPENFGRYMLQKTSCYRFSGSIQSLCRISKSAGSMNQDILNLCKSCC